MSKTIFVSSPRQCQAAGGTVTQEIPGGLSPTGVSMGGYMCFIPDVVAAPPPAPVITVSPQIVTQVSPQISPVFQQQFQPTNSPATAGTSQQQAAPSPLPPSAPAQAPAAPGVVAASPIAAPPSLPMAAPAPVYVPPPPQSTSYPGGVSSPDMGPSTVPTLAPAASGFDWKTAAIIGGSLASILMLVPLLKGR